MGVVSCILAAMSTRVDFYSGAAWSAMPSVATRPISVVDVCCRHTLHVSWQPAVVPSASICLPLRKVCLLLLVDVLLCARKWWVKERGDHLRKAGGGGQKMKGWKEGDRELRKVSACCVRGNQGVEHKAMQPSDPSTLRH